MQDTSALLSWRKMRQRLTPGRSRPAYRKTRRHASSDSQLRKNRQGQANRRAERMRTATDEKGSGMQVAQNEMMGSYESKYTELSDEISVEQSTTSSAALEGGREGVPYEPNTRHGRTALISL